MGSLGRSTGCAFLPADQHGSTAREIAHGRSRVSCAVFSQTRGGVQEGVNHVDTGFGGAAWFAIQGIEENRTPLAGGFERINAYAYFAWIVVLATRERLRSSCGRGGTTARRRRRESCQNQTPAVDLQLVGSRVRPSGVRRWRGMSWTGRVRVTSMGPVDGGNITDCPRWTAALGSAIQQFEG